MGPFYRCSFNIGDSLNLLCLVTQCFVSSAARISFVALSDDSGNGEGKSGCGRNLRRTQYVLPEL
jgi:hypothetical protein